MKNKIVKYKVPLLLIFISICFIFIAFYPYITNNRPFLFSADQQLQYNYFYQEWDRMIDLFFENYITPFYSFNTFLGNNFFASKAYYVTGDIFFGLVRMFDSLEFGLMIETFLLILISSLTFSYFLRCFGIKKPSIIIWASLLYAFSGIAELYVGQYMFHRFFCFLPLLLAGVEKYRAQKGVLLFCVSTFVLFLSNYYFMFSTSIYLVFYYFFTIIYHSDSELKIITILKSAIPLIVSYIIGFMMSCILIFPAILYVLGNDRIGNNEFIQLIFDLKVYVGLFFSYLAYPFNVYTDIPNMFVSGQNGHLTWYSLTTSIAIIPPLFSIFVSKEKKANILRNFYILLLVFLSIPCLNSIMHGFSEPSFRWIFLIVLTNLLIFSVIMNDNLLGAKIVRGGFVYLFIFSILLVLAFIAHIIDIETHSIYLLALVLFLLVLFFYIYLYKKNKIMLVLVISCVEILSLYTLSLLILNKNYYEFVPSLNKDYIHYNDSLDIDKFYRMYVNPKNLLPSSDLNLNQSINMGYKSTATYDSMIEPSLKLFLNLNNFDWHIVSLDDPEVLRMLGVKYYYVVDESELPEGYQFQYTTNVNHFKVYEMTEYRPIGFTYNQFIKRSECLERKCKINWNEQLIVDDDLMEIIENNDLQEDTNFELIEYFNENSLYGNINLTKPAVLFFSIPYNKGWQIYDNNQYIEYFNVQGGFIGVYLEPGDHYLNLIFKPPGFKFGVVLSAIGVVLFIFLIINDIHKRKMMKFK